MNVLSPTIIMLIGGFFVASLTIVAQAATPRSGSAEKGTSPSKSSDRPPPLAPGERIFATPAAEFIAKAEGGDTFCQSWLGDHYMFLREGKKYPEEAFRWYLRAAQGNFQDAMVKVGDCYYNGNGVARNDAEAFRWYTKANDAGGWIMPVYKLAICHFEGRGTPKMISKGMSLMEQAANSGFVFAQFYLGSIYADGEYGMGIDQEAACKWWALAAAKGDAPSLTALGVAYVRGEGVPRNEAMGVRLWRRAAEQGFGEAQYRLGSCYLVGANVAKDYRTAYVWAKLAANQGVRGATEVASKLSSSYLSRQQLADANAEIKAFKPRVPRPLDDTSDTPSKKAPTTASKPKATTKPKEEGGSGSGSGFFITSNGVIATNHHVIDGAKRIRVVSGSEKEIIATVITSDKTADLALLKVFVPAGHPCLPVAPARGVKLGATVATVGFPNPGVQGHAPKLSKGEIAGLAGIHDDPGRFQISVPIQPGNSGGALVDSKGNVVGVICSLLRQDVAIATTGTIANSVAYAVKSSLLSNLIESVPDLAEKLPPVATTARPFEDIVTEMEHAAVLILVEF